MKIACRLGHQRTGADGAAPGEYDITRQYGPYAMSGFLREGHQVLNVTPPEANRSLADSLNYGIRMANNWGADLFVSFHANHVSVNARGCEVVYGSSAGARYAQDVVGQLEQLGFPTHQGAYRDQRGLAEIRRTNMTAIIVEPVFTSSSADMALYSQIGPERLGYAIVAGITGIPVMSTNKNGWFMENSQWYFYKNGLALKNTWAKDAKGTWFYLTDTGAMAKSLWTQYGGLWYYLDVDGVMARSQWIKSRDGKSYYVNKDGVMLTNTIVDGWVIGSDGAWDGKPQIKNN